jgi:hypothetical protein
MYVSWLLVTRRNEPVDAVRYLKYEMDKEFLLLSSYFRDDNDYEIFSE